MPTGNRTSRGAFFFSLQEKLIDKNGLKVDYSRSMRLPRVFPKDGTAVFHCVSHLIPELGYFDSEEKDKFKEMIYKRADFCGFQVLTFCVMGNHFHLLLRAKPVDGLSEQEVFLKVRKLYGEEHREFKKMNRLREETGSIPKIMLEGFKQRMGEVSIYLKELKEGFSRWYNNRHDRKGTIWRERFGSTLIQEGSAAVFSVAAYIDLNPVRAGLVTLPEDFAWSGLSSAMQGDTRAQIGIEALFGNGKQWNQVEWEYRAKVYVSGGVVHQPGKVSLDDEVILRVLEEVSTLGGTEPGHGKNRYFSEGVALGSKEFVDHLFEEYWKTKYSQRTEGGIEVGDGVPGLEGCFVFRKIADPHGELN